MMLEVLARRVVSVQDISAIAATRPAHAEALQILKGSFIRLFVKNTPSCALPVTTMIVPTTNSPSFVIQ